MEQLNPDIKEIKYGKKKLTSLTIYPLSIGDQFKFTDLVTELVKSLMEAKNLGNTSDYAFMTASIKVIQNNVVNIFPMITDKTPPESEEIINELTNSQFMDIVEIIWTVNYEPSIKKGKSLYEKGKSLFRLKNLSPDSSNPTLSTDSKTSTENLTKTEE
jgi:hypothetical protein